MINQKLALVAIVGNVSQLTQGVMINSASQSLTQVSSECGTRGRAEARTYLGHKRSRANKSGSPRRQQYESIFAAPEAPIPDDPRWDC